jgi:hypothetical protein
MSSVDEARYITEKSALDQVMALVFFSTQNNTNVPPVRAAVLSSAVQKIPQDSSAFWARRIEADATYRAQIAAWTPKPTRWNTLQL